MFTPKLGLHTLGWNSYQLREDGTCAHPDTYAWENNP